ncbi:MAG: YcjX family protein [Paracoccaceae bacterium]
MGIGDAIGNLADDLMHGAEQAWRGVDEMFEPVLRLGVTGLSGAGKTVFITSLVASLLARGRMRLLRAEADGRILASMLRPQPDPDIPSFAYDAHIAALTGATPDWPDSTRQISQLRLSLKVRPSGLFSGLTGTRTVHLDIVDYPGEWLLDLPILQMSYADWSATALETARAPARIAHAEGYLGVLTTADPVAPYDEALALQLASEYRSYLAECRAAGLSALAPGRFLMPGDLEGSPALTFAPLPKADRPGRSSLWHQMEHRFEAYKRVVVKPFFRNHFARLDRQVVLVDALGALAGGPRALADLTQAMADTLAAFRHGQNDWFDRLLGGRRIGKLLFVASKADHLHHEQHPQLTGLVEAMLAEAIRRAAYAGAETSAMAIAAIRASAEQQITHEGAELSVVRGARASDGKEIAVFPGQIPSDLPALLGASGTTNPAHAPAEWDGKAFARPSFAPPRWGTGPDDGPPHIGLDRAIEFLIGDRLE